jgi:hypothetical protein
MTDETDQSIIGDSSGENPGTESSQVQADYPKPVPDSDRFAGPFPGKTTFTGSVPNLSQIPAGDRIVEIWESKTKLVASVPLSSDGRWTATLDTVDGKPFYAAKLVKGSAYFDFSSLMYTAPLKVLTINQPAKDWVGAFPTISGTNAYPLAPVKLYRNGDGNTVYGSTNASVFGTWSIRVTGVSPASVMDFTCRQSWGDVHSQWAPAVKFKLLAPPTVEIPAGSIGLLASISGTATGASSGTKVNVYRDLSNEKLCIGLPHLIQRWQGYFTSAMKPGVVNVRAQQDDRGVLSEPSPLYTLRVHPDAPIISEIRWSNLAMIFKGNGYSGATVEIYPESGEPISTTVVNTQGVFERNIVVLPGTYKGWKIRQKIQDGAGWIFSPYSSSEIKFDVPTPDPTVNTPTLIGQIPTVTGRGSVWHGQEAATIVVQLIGTTTVTLSPAAVTATGDWTATTATAVAPGSYTVSVRQLMNGVYSLPVTAPAPLIIKPLAPADILVVPDGLSATVTGSCWPRASLILLFKVGGEEIPIPAIGAPDGKWTLLPMTFVPGDYTFTVTQTVSEQTSPPAGPIAFNIATPKPVITFPGNQQETGFRPEIKGTNGYDGATVAVFDNKVEGPALGQTIVPASGAWTVNLSKDLTVGEHDIFALQTFEKQASQPSAFVLFNVMVPVPSIVVPVNNRYYARRSEFSGTALPGAKVTLYLVENPGLPNETEIEYLPPGGVVVDVNGNWKANVFFEQVGSKNLRIKQAYAGGTRSSVTRTFLTVPNAPMIESPNAGESVNPAAVVLSGHGFPGDNVKVRRKGYTEVIGNYVVNAVGQWSGTLTSTLNGASPYSLETWSTRDGLGGDISDAAVVNLQDLDTPFIEHPSPGDVLVSRLVFSGQGLPGAKIQVADLFNPEIPLAPVTTVDEFGEWSVKGNTTFVAGPHWVIVQQTLGEKKSPWVRSGRFIIEAPPTGFMAPTLDRPLPGAQVGLEPMLAGRGVAGAELFLLHNGKTESLTHVNAQGCWSARLPELAVGKFTFAIIQARLNFWSAPLTPDVTVDVIQVKDNFAAPTVEFPTPGSTVDARFWLSGKGMPGAIINVHKSLHGATVYASVLVDAFGNWRACVNQAIPVGIFSLTVRQLLDGKSSAFCDDVVVTVNDALPVPFFDNTPVGSQIAPVTRIYGTGFPGAKVVLHKSGDASTVWGEGEVNAKGYWAIWTKSLPLGPFTMTAKQVKGTLNSGWMPQRAFTVVNAG